MYLQWGRSQWLERPFPEGVAPRRLLAGTVARNGTGCFRMLLRYCGIVMTGVRVRVWGEGVRRGGWRRKGRGRVRMEEMGSVEVAAQ